MHLRFKEGHTSRDGRPAKLHHIWSLYTCYGSYTYHFREPLKDPLSFHPFNTAQQDTNFRIPWLLDFSDYIFGRHLVYHTSLTRQAGEIMFNSSSSSPETITLTTFANVADTASSLPDFLSYIDCLRHAVDDNATNLHNENTDIRFSNDQGVAKQNLVKSIERLLTTVSQFHNLIRGEQLNNEPGKTSSIGFHLTTKSQFQEAQFKGMMNQLSWDGLKSDLKISMEAESHLSTGETKLNQILREVLNESDFHEHFVKALTSLEEERTSLFGEGVSEDDVLAMPKFTSVLSELFAKSNKGEVGEEYNDQSRLKFLDVVNSVFQFLAI